MPTNFRLTLASSPQIPGAEDLTDMLKRLQLLFFCFTSYQSYKNLSETREEPWP